MPGIHFEARLDAIGSWIILRLPDSASAKLPSRGQTMIEGTINDLGFRTPLEPDGRGSHWFRVDNTVLNAVKAAAGDTVTLSIRPVKEWVEPDVPADLRSALAAAPRARSLWRDITPMAHWEWIRWIRSTNSPETRRKRIEVACSKLEAGKRRPCCWNRNLCTEPSVSKNGVLRLSLPMGQQAPLVLRMRRTGDVVRR
jgi:hypothetical protein